MDGENQTGGKGDFPNRSAFLCIQEENLEAKILRRTKELTQFFFSGPRRSIVSPEQNSNRSWGEKK